MDPQIIATSVIVGFIGILLFGFLWGLIRGFNKSTTRLLIVVCCLVITLFIVPSISKSLMTVNIASFNITIGDSTQVATTLPELVKIAIESFLPADYASIASYKSFEVILTVLPQMIINIVLFVLVFYALRFISMIIYWIIAGICFNKKKTAGKSRHRLLGSLMGVIQNFIIFLVLLVPVVGVINIVGKAESVITEQTQQNAPSNPTETASLDYYAYAQEATTGSDNQDQSSTNNSQSSSNSANDSLIMVNDVINAYKGTWVYKMLNAVKLNDACNLVFDNLTTIKYEKQKYTLSKEVESLVNIYDAYKDIKDAGGFDDITSETTITGLQKLIDRLYEGKFTALLADELVKDAATQLSDPNDGEFFGLKLPEDMQYRDVIVNILADLSSSNNIHKELITATSTLKIIAKNKDILDTSNGEGLTADKIGNLLEDLANDKDVFELVGDVVVKNLDSLLPPPEEGTEQNPYVGAIKETVTSIFTTEYEVAKNEIPVISSTLGLVQKITDASKAEGDEPVTITKDDAKPVIEALAKSDIIYNVLVSEETTSEVAKLIQDLPSDQLQVVQDAIGDIEAAVEAGTSNLDAAKLAKLQQLFTAKAAA